MFQRWQTVIVVRLRKMLNLAIQQQLDGNKLGKQSIWLRCKTVKFSFCKAKWSIRQHCNNLVLNQHNLTTLQNCDNRSFQKNSQQFADKLEK